MYLKRYFLESIFLFFLVSCQGQGTTSSQILTKSNEIIKESSHPSVIVGAARLDTLQVCLAGKKVGLVANQTSRVGDTHLVDTLLELGIDIEKVYSPEHGFRGKADAGAKVNSKTDEKTGLPIVSLYGNNKKPTKEQLQGIDVLVFDLQDVGARFYTYISTLHYVMEAAAENGIPVVVLDRPNPNGSYVDGPIRDADHVSFVGVDPLPIVYGMTIGELAKMINGEGWLKNSVKCKLTVIKCLHYTHQTAVELPVSPSPNLRSTEAIALYPSLCLFEGTIVSVGRGTKQPFEIFGHPQLKGKADYTFTYTPQPGAGAQHPKLEGKQCYGLNLKSFAQQHPLHQLRLDWLIDAYHALGRDDFFNARWFDLLAGTSTLRKQIIAGKTVQEIRASWQKDLDAFKQKRAKYLLYK